MSAVLNGSAKRKRSSTSPETRSSSPAKRPVLLDSWSPASTTPSTTVPQPAPLGPPNGLTLANANGVLSGYIGSLRNNLSLHNAVYTVTDAPPPEKGFQCALALPYNCPVRAASSKGTWPSKQAAKSSAAFNALCDLYAHGEVTVDLKLTPKNPTKAARAGPTSAGGGKKGKSAMTGTETYDYIPSARFWQDCPPLSKHVFGSVVHLTIPKHQDEEKQNRRLLFVTSVPLPMSTPLTVDVSVPGVEASLTFHPSLALKFSSTKNQLEKTFAYTLTLLRGTHKRPYSAKLQSSAYLVLPLGRGYEGTEATPQDIDWIEVEETYKPSTTTVEGLTADELTSRLTEGVGYRAEPLKLLYYTTQIAPDLTPSSPHPQHPGKTIQEVFDEIAVKERFVPAEESSPFVITTERYHGPRTSGVVGSLAPPPENHAKEEQLLVPAGCLKIFPISASSLRTASMLSDGLASLDRQLLAVELSHKLFRGTLDPILARQAITSPSARPTANTDNYERLELLGDTLLKFIVGVSCYAEKTATQGQMSHTRHEIVNNNALRQAIMPSGAIPYIRNRYRAAKDFAPPMWWVEGVDLSPPTDQVLGDKILADVCEALIAVEYLSCGRKIPAALDAMHRLHVSVQLTDWSSLSSIPAPSGAFSLPNSPPGSHENVMRERAAQGDLTLLGYKFKDPRRGRIALSMSRNAIRVREFERYEYLGDALLDYLTVETLWDKYPDAAQGPLTHMKHSRVGNAAFSAYLVLSGLINELRDVSIQMGQRLERFHKAIVAAHQGAEQRVAQGETVYEFWSSVPEHKAFGDVLEAIMGAIYDDSGFDLATMKRIYKLRLVPFLNKHCVPPREHSLHPKSALLEIIAKKSCKHFQLSTVKEKTKPKTPTKYDATIVLHGKEVGRGTAATQAVAVRNVCAETLRYIAKMGGIEALCDCKK